MRARYLSPVFQNTHRACACCTPAVPYLPCWRSREKHAHQNRHSCSHAHWHPDHHAVHRGSTSAVCLPARAGHAGGRNSEKRVGVVCSLPGFSPLNFIFCYLTEVAVVCCFSLVVFIMLSLIVQSGYCSLSVSVPFDAARMGLTV